MLKRVLRVGVIAGAALGLLGTTTPAHAVTVGSVSFVGTATTPALGYPCAPPATTTNCPPPVGSGPRSGAYTFASIACVGAKADVAKPDKGTTAYPGLCQIRAEGQLTGYCGLSSSTTGTGTVTFTNAATGQTKTVQFTQTFTGVGGTLVVRGTSQKGTLVGVVQAIPDPTRGSCAMATQTGFFIVGEAGFVDPNVP